MRCNGDVAFTSTVQKMERVKRKHHGKDEKKPMKLNAYLRSQAKHSSVKPGHWPGVVSPALRTARLLAFFLGFGAFFGSCACYGIVGQIWLKRKSKNNSDSNIYPES